MKTQVMFNEKFLEEAVELEGIKELISEMIQNHSSLSRLSSRIIDTLNFISKTVHNDIIEEALRNESNQKFNK